MVLRQRSHDLGIVELVEVPIELADRHEVLRGVQADDPVDLGLHPAAATGTARISSAGPARRTARSAARTVAPVAIPSSITTATRPASPGRGLPDR